MLQDSKAVADSIQQAKDAADQSFNTEMEKAETEALAEGGGELIFGDQLPKLDGNQIILNSERVLISSKSGEMVSFSKGKYAVATDGELTMNAVKRIVTVTSEHTSVISPTIHLGDYITTRHPVLKGDEAVAWLNSLCGWLKLSYPPRPLYNNKQSCSTRTIIWIKSNFAFIIKYSGIYRRIICI